MLNIKVKYILNEMGAAYFPIWFNDVLCETQKQEGFLEIKYVEDDNENNFIVYLRFESHELLDKWSAKHAHDQLVSKIEPYFITSPEVDIEVV